MDELIVVVESRTDADLLRKLLPTSDCLGLRFFTAPERISLESVARNILVDEGRPVLVVMDADTLDPDMAAETRLYAKAAIRHVAGHVPVDVFSFIPEIAVAFFEAPEGLAQLLGRELSTAELDQGLIAPKRTLAKLLKEREPPPASEALVARIEVGAAAALRKGKQLSALIEIVHQFMPEVRVA